MPAQPGLDPLVLVGGGGGVAGRPGCSTPAIHRLGVLAGTDAGRDKRAGVDNPQKDRTDGRGVGVNASRRDWRLVAGVVVMLVALIVAGRLQGQSLGAGDAGPSPGGQHHGGNG
jgi:hypothetical protein